MSERALLSDEGACGPLAGLRVVEIGKGSSAPYAAKLLADFGAQVIKVETAAGDSSRSRGPFPHDRPDPEASGLFAYLNTNKFGLRFDPGETDSREALRRLLEQADILITNFSGRWLDAAGLAPARLRLQCPQLIITTLTPFGSDGSWAARSGDELLTYAMGGLAFSTPGMPDASENLDTEPPLHPNCFVAETLAGLAAAHASVAAVHERARTGRGSHVELSQHATVASLQHRDVTTHAYLGGVYERLLNPVTIGRMPNFYLPCKDGYVTIAAPMELHWQRLIEAMGSPDWARDEKFSTPRGRTAHWIELRERLIGWTMTLSGDELYRIAGEQQLPVFPFYPVRKTVESAQVRARKSLVTVQLGASQAQMPGAPLVMGDTPWSLRRAAPRLGEHTEALLSRGWPQSPERASSAMARDRDRAASAGVAAEHGGASGPYRPLAGVTVLDLGQFIAIPFCTLWLAWLGADVIIVESGKRMTSRSAPPFLPGFEGNPDATGYFNLLNSSKKSCRVDMTTDEGRKLVRQLAEKVDVIVDNFSTGVIDKLGLGYESLKAVNPGLIAVSCGAFGRTGPMKMARGLHSAVNLFSGVADVTGYAGGAPRILGGVLPDPLAGTCAGFAILSALLQRRITGKGQFVDLAMYEAMLTLIPEAVVDLTLNDREPTRIGNRDPFCAPHGIFPCREQGDWVAISVRDDEAWRRLCAALGREDWMDDKGLSEARGRCERVDEIERDLRRFTGRHSSREVTELLQGHYIAAGPVVRVDQLLDDPILLERGTVITTDHPVVGVRKQLGLPWRTDGFAVDYRRAPLLGEHTRHILGEILGIDDTHFARLEADGVLA